MQGPADETVGSDFSLEKLEQARDQTLSVILEAAALIKPGTSEKEARALVAEIQARMGAPKSWHPPQIRFGENTVLPFGAKGKEDIRLQANDIFFFDIGPIFDGHEGDVGRAFSVGYDPEMEKCCRDAEAIWHEMREKWQKEQITGEKLYDFAKARAQNRGWVLSLEKANGHRVADFPHAARGRGSVESFSGHLAPHRWVLEIQIRHPSRPFGAFFEDLLV
jgi:Xaa-Pro aminopeptidase